MPARKQRVVKKTMLEARLQKRLRVKGVTSFRDYCDLIFNSPDGEDELVGVVGQRFLSLEQNLLGGLDMGPSRLRRDKVGIKQAPAVVIQRCDERPLVAGIG